MSHWADLITVVLLFIQCSSVFRRVCVCEVMELFRFVFSMLIVELGSSLIYSTIALYEYIVVSFLEMYICESLSVSTTLSLRASIQMNKCSLL